MRSESLGPVVSVHNRDNCKAPLPIRTRALLRPQGVVIPAPEQGEHKHAGPDRPRVVRMPSDWWDSPSVTAMALAPAAHPARNARRFTRTTLCRWGLGSLADDAEIIVGEFVANAIRHGTSYSAGMDSAISTRDDPRLELRLFRRAGEVMCAVLDPGDRAPVLKNPAGEAECGRGLQLVDALSDVWGWSPVTGRGKAVWAILFCA